MTKTQIYTCSNPKANLVFLRWNKTRGAAADEIVFCLKDFPHNDKLYSYETSEKANVRILLTFKRTISNPNKYTLERVSGQGMHFGWVPFVPRSMRESVNKTIENERDDALNFVKGIFKVNECFIEFSEK